MSIQDHPYLIRKLINHISSFISTECLVTSTPPNITSLYLWNLVPSEVSSRSEHDAELRRALAGGRDQLPAARLELVRDGAVPRERQSGARLRRGPEFEHRRVRSLPLPPHLHRPVGARSCHLGPRDPRNRRGWLALLVRRAAAASPSPPPREETHRERETWKTRLG